MGWKPEKVEVEMRPVQQGVDRFDGLAILMLSFYWLAGVAGNRREVVLTPGKGKDFLLSVAKGQMSQVKEFLSPVAAEVRMLPKKTMTSNFDLTF